MVIEQITEKEEITALRKLLHETLNELFHVQNAYPKIACSQISSVLERGTVALRVTDLRAHFRP